MATTSDLRTTYQETLGAWCAGVIALGDPVTTLLTEATERRRLARLRALVERCDQLLEVYEALLRPGPEGALEAAESGG
ncbi:MAG: hypothetical protein WC273_07010 [Dehalococcoidia bacterium]